MFLSEYQSDVFSVLLSLLLECFLVNISLMYLVFLSEYRSDVFSVLLLL